MTIPSPKQLEELLVAGGLCEDEAERRAPMLHEDFKWIGFRALRLEGRLGGQGAVIPEYLFGNTEFSVDHAHQGDEICYNWIQGTGLDRGHLQLFSLVSKIARQRIPDIWLRSARFRASLRNPTQHLDTVEEVCWLDRWTNPSEIEASKILRSGSAKDVDWRFRVSEDTRSPILVNLEVKRLVGDVLRHTKGRTLKPEWFDEFCQKHVIPKFRSSEEQEVNVLALSLFGEICREVQVVVSEWLSQRQDVIDLVLITSRESRRGRPFDWHFANEKAKRIKRFIREPSPEEQGLIFLLSVPVHVPGIPNIARE